MKQHQSKKLASQAETFQNIIKGEFKGNFMTIKDSLNSLVNVLNQCFGEISHSAEQVSSGAGQVLDGAQALSEGSADQSSAVEELLAMVSEISGQVSENAKNAVKAEEKADVSSRNLGNSKDQMQEMIYAMDEISESANGIRNIINTIEDIASQTNLLALNALHSY